MVRIYRVKSAAVTKTGLRHRTYDNGINEDSPVVAVLEKGENERHGSRGKEDDDQLVLELFQDEFPERCWWVLGKS